MTNDLITVDVSSLIEVTEEVKQEVALLSKDFDRSRENIINVIDKGNEAINDFSELAKQAQHPKAYEALATLMKAVIDANRMLLDIHGITNKIDQNSRKGNDNSITTNNGNTNIIITTSTKELLRAIKLEDKDIDDV